MLILFAAAGMSVMVSATSLISLYVGLELNSLASYVLAAYRRRDDRSAEAGLKYFVLGALASGILLYGISLLYGFTGTTNFTGIAAAFAHGAPSLGLLFGLVFLLAGLAFKISAVPFHMPEDESDGGDDERKRGRRTASRQCRPQPTSEEAFLRKDCHHKAHACEKGNVCNDFAGVSTGDVNRSRGVGEGGQDAITTTGWPTARA